MNIESIINILLFVAIILDFGLAFFILVKSSRKESDYAFVSSTLLVGLWTLGILMFRLTDDLIVAMFWNREFIFTAGLIASTFLHFAFSLTGTRQNFIIKSLFYLPNFFILIGLFIPGAFIKEVVFQSWGKESILGYLYPLFGIYFSVYIIYALFKIFHAYKKAINNFKAQLGYIFWATLLTSIVGTYFNLYLILLGNYKYIWVGPYNSLILVTIIAYAITKHRLMDISVVISRTVAWFLTIIFYGGIYTGLVLAYRTYISTEIGILYWAWTILYGILVGHNFQRTRLFLQTTTDRAFIKGWYDYRHVLRKVAADLGRALTCQDIVKTLYPIFQDEIDIAEVNFYFPDETNNSYSVLNPVTGELSSLFLDKDHPLIKKAMEKKDIAACDRKLCVPSFSGNNLLSFFVLGKKRSEDEYTDDDIELFKTISEYVAIALEYIVKPYEEVRDKFEATERKLMEAERQLERSERLASLGTLTAGIAHEIRNPLGIIHSTAEELTDKLRNMEELEDYKKSILRNTRRITTIITNMLNMAKTNEKKLSKLDVNKIIEDSLKLVTINGIKIIKDLQPVSKNVGDEDEIKQIMINLYANAVEAMPKGGEIGIRTYQIEKDVYIEVSDTGIGIPKENQAKIFDPFYSTRHEGSGLGLSIVYRIVKEHGGDVKVKSEVGRGATFTIRFSGVE